MENHSTIVMLVALVAVGAVFTLTDGFAGAAVRTATPRDSAIQIGAEQSDHAVGNTIGHECLELERGNTDYCCAMRCESYCAQGRYGDELAKSSCFRVCRNSCEDRL